MGSCDESNEYEIDLNEEKEWMNIFKTCNNFRIISCKDVIYSVCPRCKTPDHAFYRFNGQKGKKLSR